MRILVVDDAPGMCELLTDVLSAPGTRIDQAGTCTDARRLLEKNAYDWAVLDNDLPDGTGLELLCFVGTRLPRPRILMLTSAGHDPRFCRRALLLGAQRVFAKPCDLNKVRAFVHKSETTRT